jgi:hypothetical protein
MRGLFSLAEFDAECQAITGDRAPMIPASARCRRRGLPMSANGGLPYPDDPFDVERPWTTASGARHSLLCAAQSVAWKTLIGRFALFHSFVHASQCLGRDTCHRHHSGIVVYASFIHIDFDHGRSTKGRR